MMSELSPLSLFDLSNYQHASLFKQCDFAWRALSHIIPYLRNSPLGVIEGEVSPGAYLINPELISIGEGTIVEPGAYIKGPCVIGKNCTIRHGAYVRGDVITGNNCVIGHDTEIKHSILLDGAQAAHFAYVGDSILGNRVNLGAGTKCANLKLDHKSIEIRLGAGNRIDTGLRKFGAMLGDDVQLGCNSVTNPGTVMGKGSCCYPCVNVGGVIPAYHVVKLESSTRISSLRKL